MSEKLDTIPRLLRHQAEVRGDKVAMRVKHLGVWKNYTWRDVLDEVRRLACGLCDMEVAGGDTVVVIGGNTPRLFFAMTACQAIGAIPVPVYGNLAGEELADMLKRVGASCAVAEDQQQVDALLDLKRHGVELRAIIYAVGRGMSGYDRALIYDFAVVQERGDSYAALNPGRYDELVDSADAEKDTALILFSSGVVGIPMPAMLRHRQVLGSANYVAEVERLTDQDEVLSFMPISLPPNLLCGYVLSHVSGMCLSCPESSETVMENLREIGPSVLYAPPHVYKQIRASIRERISLTRGLSRWLYDYYMERKKPIARRGLNDVLVAAPVREIYGLNHLRVAFTGGDAISADVFTFFVSLGVQLKQIYGVTETFGFITMQVEEPTEKDVGYVVRGMEVKISDTGEVLCRGDNVFSGYYRDDRATNEALRDGWFHTGDAGELSSDGKLTVVDKMVARSRLQDGTEFMPKAIEREIKESIYINEAFVSGDGEQSLVAVVTIEDDTVAMWADRQDIHYAGFSELAQKPEVLDLVRGEIVKANERLGRSAVGRLFIFHRDLSPHNGELTWTHKLRRSVMHEHFGDMLRALHDGRPSFEFDDRHSGVRVNLQALSV